MVMMTGSLSVRGTVVWLTPQQGGRVSGPPEPDYDYDYTATAYLPPRTAEGGQVGIALRRFAPGAWRSPAEGIMVPGQDHRAQQVVPGCVVVVTEGVRPVGLLTVEEVQALAPEGTPDTGADSAPDNAWGNAWAGASDNALAGASDNALGSPAGNTWGSGSDSAWDSDPDSVPVGTPTAEPEPAGFPRTGLTPVGALATDPPFRHSTAAARWTTPEPAAH